MRFIKGLSDTLAFLKHRKLLMKTTEKARAKLANLESLAFKARGVDKESPFFEEEFSRANVSNWKKDKLKAYEEIITPEYLFNEYNELLTSTDIRLIFSLLSDQISDGKIDLPFIVTAAFRRIAEYIPSEDTIQMANLISSDHVFKLSTIGSKEFSTDTINSLASMMRNTKAHERIRLFSAFEKNDFLRDLFGFSAAGGAISYFFNSLFEGKDIDTLHLVMGTSNSLNFVKPSKHLRDWFIYHDSRYLELMKYAKGV